MGEVRVRVAVRIRPLLPKEVLHRHKVCVRAVPGGAQVMLASERLFSFDHVFGWAAGQDEVYAACVRPLVESLVAEGNNATVFCYGQTGSGKTYTLGGGSLDEEGGIVGRVAQDVFLLLGEKRKSSDAMEATVRVSYMELYKEELRDLLETTGHKDLHIREDKGKTVVVGAKEIAVTSAEELFGVLDRGKALRHVSSTEMNEDSSRSHCIVTLNVVQCWNSSGISKSVCSSKLCLVDLAGLERAGKTGNTGARLKESSYINTGLLALGNVIRALSHHAQDRHGNGGNSTYVPYRDAKITRLLRDSLGGTAHTLMMACVSPSDRSLAETLGVLQFASMACHVRNCPSAMSTHTEVSAWDFKDTRLGELENEVQMLRELLIEREGELQGQKETTGGKAAEGDGCINPIARSEPDQEANQLVPSEYRLLTLEAAALLTDISGPSPSHSFKQRAQDWHERLKVVMDTHQIGERAKSGGGGDQPDHVTIFKLREELNRCQEALSLEQQLLQQKDAELRQAQKHYEKLLEERKIHLQASEKQKDRILIQTEKMVDQQIRIDRLRSDVMSLRSATSGPAVDAVDSGNSGKSPHTVPLIGPTSGRVSPVKIPPSPPAHFLERVMAAFKVRGQLLLAEQDEKDEVHCPFTEQQPPESKDWFHDKNEEDDSCVPFRCCLNRTWTKLEKSGDPFIKQPQHAIGTKENNDKPSHKTKASLRASVTQRRIQDLSVVMCMKEDLIIKLEKTDKEIRAVGAHGSHSQDGSERDILEKLSEHNQQVRTEVHRSLQHMRLQREQLQNFLRQQRQTPENSSELGPSEEQITGDMKECTSSPQEGSQEKLERSWLEQQEEYVLQQRAELQELKEELRRREEVFLRKEACLQKKNKLEIKRLRSSQALSRDLLRVSVQLASVEEHLQSRGSARVNGGVTAEELEKEREMLKQRREAVDARLKANRLLTAEEDHSLLQLEESIEALDAALEFKDSCIQSKQQMLIRNSSPCESQSTEPAQLCDLFRELRVLSPPELSELLVKYFNKVVCLRELERRLRLRCDELELHVAEKEEELREMEATLQCVVLDTDRRFTQQHKDHQKNLQLFLQKLQEGGSGESLQAIQVRAKHLEKKLFYYKSSYQQLKEKLKEPSQEPDSQSTHKRQHRHSSNMQIRASTNNSQSHAEKSQGRPYMTASHTKIHAEQTDQRTQGDSHEESCAPNSLSSDQTHTHSRRMDKGTAGDCGECQEMRPVRLCRRELRQISRADLQLSGSATRGRPPLVGNSTESIFEDSIDASCQADSTSNF